jgi:cytoskeletal protein RodZ
MFKTKKMRSFLAVVVLLMVGVTVWLVLAKPSVISNRDKTEIAKSDKDSKKKSESKNNPVETQKEDESLAMPYELTQTGGIDIVTPVALAGVAFTGTSYLRSKKQLK